MRISLDEGYFFVHILFNGDTRITHKGGTFIRKSPLYPADLEGLAVELDAFPWITHEEEA